MITPGNKKTPMTKEYLKQLRSRLLRLLSKDVKGFNTTNSENAEIARTLDMISKQCNLTTVQPPKTYIGEPELHILIKTAHAQNRNWDHTFKHITIWLLMMFTAVRPGSLILSTSYQDADRALKWSDINLIYKGFDKLGPIFQATITFRTIKGGYKDGLQPLSWTIHSVQDASKLDVCPIIMLIIWAFRCKVFKVFKTPDELFRSKYTNIEWTPDKLNSTVFLNNAGTSPLTVNSIDGFLAIIAQKAGFADPITSYAYRRSAADAITNSKGQAVAKQALYHELNSPKLHKHYTQRPDIDIVGIMLGSEASSQKDTVIENRHPLIQITP
ncbi:hypothetical protein BC936DRAFT_143193, partial [Jimgerdemannia flammicorona]